MASENIQPFDLFWEADLRIFGEIEGSLAPTEYIPRIDVHFFEHVYSLEDRYAELKLRPLSLREFASLVAVHQDIIDKFQYATVVSTKNQTYYVFLSKRRWKSVIFQAFDEIKRMPSNFVFTGVPLG